MSSVRFDNSGQDPHAPLLPARSSPPSAIPRLFPVYRAFPTPCASCPRHLHFQCASARASRASGIHRISRFRQLSAPASGDAACRRHGRCALHVLCAPLSGVDRLRAVRPTGSRRVADSETRRTLASAPPVVSPARHGSLYQIQVGRTSHLLGESSFWVGLVRTVESTRAPQLSVQGSELDSEAALRPAKGDLRARGERRRGRLPNRNWVRD
jgi:hypothetical protein